MAELGPSYPIC